MEEERQDLQGVPASETLFINFTMNSMTDKLRSSIDGLYQAFADQPEPPPINGCSQCFEEHELDALLSKPPQ